MSVIEQAVRNSLSGKFPIFVFILSVLLGTMALKFTPREEEPQIVVPMLDILVAAPNTDAPEVARLVTTPLEKLLMQIPGVEHVYSSTQTGGTAVTLRFYVGEDREKAIDDPDLVHGRASASCPKNRARRSAQDDEDEECQVSACFRTRCMIKDTSRKPAQKWAHSHRFKCARRHLQSRRRVSQDSKTGHHACSCVFIYESTCVLTR